MAYPEIRLKLLASLQETVDAAPANVRQSLQDSLDELQATERAASADPKLWRLFNNSVGQFVEGLLIGRLRNVEPPVDVSRVNGLQQLMNLARRYDVLAPESSRRSSGSAFTSAQTLRNWSSHFQLSARSASDLRATQSIALALCAAETLYPTPPLQRSDEQKAMGGMIKRFMDAPKTEPVEPDIVEAIDHLSAYVTTMALATINWYERDLRAHELPTGAFAAAIVEAFPAIVRRAARVNSNVLRHILDVYKRNGARAHASVFAALLPITPEAVRELLLSKSPAAAAIYLADCQDADEALCRWKLGRMPTDAAFVAALWRRFREKNVAIINIGRIISVMPAKVRVAYMSSAPPDFLREQMRACTMSQAFAMLPLLRTNLAAADLPPRVRERFEAVRAALLSGTIEMINRVPLRDLRGVPRIIFGTHMARDPAGITIADAVLKRIADADRDDSDFWESARRAIADAYMFFDALAGDALALAARLVNETTVPRWETLSLIGLLEVAQIEIGLEPISGDVAAALLPPEHADRWASRLVLLAALRHFRFDPATLPGDLLERARLDDLANVDARSPRSRILLEKLAEALPAAA